MDSRPSYRIYGDGIMKIERVDERTVKCFLSNEELEEYDIDYKDFILRSDKAREVVQEIIEQAEEQVRFRPADHDASGSGTASDLFGER